MSHSDQSGQAKPVVNVEERQFTISGDNIELYKLLKLEGLCPSGGFAKLAIADGQVRVDGDIERRKRKKILPQQIVEFNGVRITLLSE